MVKSHMKNKVMVIDELDKIVWKQITDVPFVSRFVAVLSAFFNLILPGFGTMIASCAG